MGAAEIIALLGAGAALFTSLVSAYGAYVSKKDTIRRTELDSMKLSFEQLQAVVQTQAEYIKRLEVRVSDQDRYIEAVEKIVGEQKIRIMTLEARVKELEAENQMLRSK